MAFDATFLSAVADELRGKVLGARVDKIQQPEKNCLILQLHDRAFSGRLLISAASGSARVHLTETSPENPAQPPMFCMLLRKHLTGARIAEITQPPLERLLDFTLDCTDELGEPCRKHLIAELTGRSANLILLGADGRIVDCLRRAEVDLDDAGKRQLLPGLYYRLPPLAEKCDPAAAEDTAVDALLETVAAPVRLEKWLLDRFGGLSPLICRELAYEVAGDIDAELSPLDAETRGAFAARLSAALKACMTAPRVPHLLREGGRPREFSYRPIRQYGGYLRSEILPSFGALLDAFYAGRDLQDRMRQRTQSMRKAVATRYERVCRKLAAQQRELAGAADREKLRRAGDLIMANLHVIQRGQTTFLAEDLYDPEGKTIELRLRPELSPQQNAARYYKDYAKAKTAETVLGEQIALGEQEKEYLAGVLDELDRAASESDVAEIREELVGGGYLRRTEKKRMKTPPAKPLVFRSSSGFLIRVGRNNRQNDSLTTKLSAKQDIWLHVQKLPGSHVVIECAGETPDDGTFTEAAQLAAWFSQARESVNVAVDCTPVKYVKKPVGAKPGMVIYTQYRTLYVTPEEALIKKLSV
ncbi:MAG: NFACT RNA binding domain-containing protein [Oscillospiraceae bacterium]|nr:NFACT RNA binding domain-containing protein [Oscillospiraceae bacterium]